MRASCLRCAHFRPLPGLVFGDKRSRSSLNSFVQSIAVKAGGQLPPEIEALISILREIANGYRRPYGPSLFFDGGTRFVDR
jgi:hypothetical protein